MRIPLTVLGYNGFFRSLLIEEKTLTVRTDLNHQTTFAISTVDNTKEPPSWRQLHTGSQSDSEIIYYDGDNDIENDLINIDDDMSDDYVDGEDSHLSSCLSHSMPSLFRNSSIQDRSLKLAHRRRRHIRRKRNFVRLCSSGSQSDEPPNRSSTKNMSKNSFSHTHCSTHVYNSDKGNSCQSDKVETYPTETEHLYRTQVTSENFIRTNSIQERSWDIRRRRKEIMYKRRSESFV
ncbi:hypothetical protein ACJMK2_019878 [Sinanodonta woodiana]|uniref:Uncharacterized protein n=1 Tax=Sinanodonta woodiana TaxID=1069815 RepID=A0ABD3U012_SINWO